jgi:predicted nuclease of predicted toxin-antitoxin system
LDADFHALAVSRADKPAVIRIRIQGLDGTAVAELVQRTVTSFAAELRHGCLLTVKTTKTTVHRLPIGGSDPILTGTD